MRILVVEDDCLLNHTLCYNLTAVGYTVDAAVTKAEAMAFYEKQDYDLVVLDVDVYKRQIHMCEKENRGICLLRIKWNREVRNWIIENKWERIKME